MSSQSPSGLGEFLRNEREKRGVSIEQVASATKIGLKRIHALEADEYSDLPAKPFIRGFVISYCRFLGVDSNDTLTRFGVFLDGKVSEHQVEKKYVEGYAFERKSGDRGRTLLMSVMAGFIVIGAVVIIVLKPNLRHKKVSHMDRLKQAHSTSSLSPEDVAEGVAHEAAALFVGPKLIDVEPIPGSTPFVSPSPIAKVAPPVTSPVAIVSPAPTPSAIAVPIPLVSSTPSPTPSVSAAFTALASDPLNKGDMLEAADVKQKLSIRSKESVWIRYKVDDKPAMKLFFKKGKLLLIRAKERVRLQVSNTDSLEFRYNDKGSYKAMTSAENLITTANSPTVVFPPQNVEISKDLFQGMAPLPQTSASSGSDALNSSQNP